MATATVFPDLAVGLVEKMAEAFGDHKVQELPPEEIAAATSICRAIRHLFTAARHSVERSLSEGVDVKAFTARYDPTLSSLELISVSVARVAASAGPAPDLAGEFLSELRALGGDVADLQHLLGEALSKAKAPLRPIDWDRVREAEAAYARGETKPVRKPTVARDAG
jgi:hypothetical protein